MENKVMGKRNISFLLSEAPGSLSREVVTVLSGEGILEAGSVLGEVTASGKFAWSPNAEVTGKEGAETAAAVLLYRVDATSADAEAVVVDTSCEVKGDELLYQSSVDDNTKKAAKATQLRGALIKVR
ncbi:head decoration protein [Afifella sp. IM 167]|uniref:head decoration protein n=1 Tax=Afifella sp. IM 167 TaxID=2033586 RepID=UPI001CD0268A|nr:head decoration protein [Afifella sp. IM 167]MBZ8133233.1 head decoration protein [Afifella sp. IM 167]